MPEAQTDGAIAWLLEHDCSPGVRAVAGACLRSPIPVVLAIGPELRIIFNDAFAPFVGAATPGQLARDALGDLWTTIGPMMESAWRGDAVTADVRLRERTVTLACSPFVALDGRTIEGVICACVADLSLQAQLRESQERLRATVDLAGLGSYYSDPQRNHIEWDVRLKALWGLPPDAPVDFEIFLSGVHPDDRERVRNAILASVDPGSGVCDIEHRVIGIQDGVERWVMVRGKTTFENGQPVRSHGVVLDISQRKRAEQTNLVLIAELEHRTRNLLAVVSALAEETLASCKSIDDFAGPFRERLATLSRVQGLLSRADASRVMIGELVQFELRALGAEPDGVRIAANGPEVALPNRIVQILALGLHELATNALKYGALSSGEGSLDVSWRVDGRLLTLVWHERGIHARGADPKHVGFGRTLIEKSLPFQLDAKTRLDIGPDEVRCVVSMVID